MQQQFSRGLAGFVFRTYIIFPLFLAWFATLHFQMPIRGQNFFGASPKEILST